jgi:hypothetical protein
MVPTTDALSPIGSLRSAMTPVAALAAAVAAL